MVGFVSEQGRLYRASLGRWSDQRVKTKGEAEAVFDRMKDAIRARKFRQREEPSDLTFSDFANLCVQRYVRVRNLRSRKHIELRLAILKERWTGRTLVSIGTGEIEDLIQDLRSRVDGPLAIEVPRDREGTSSCASSRSTSGGSPASATRLSRSTPLRRAFFAEALD